MDFGLLLLLWSSQRSLGRIVQRVLIISTIYRAILIATAWIELNCSATGCFVSELRITSIVALFSESSWCDYPEGSNYFSCIPSYSYCYSLHWAQLQLYFRESWFTSSLAILPVAAISSALCVSISRELRLPFAERAGVESDFSPQTYSPSHRTSVKSDVVLCEANKWRHGSVSVNHGVKESNSP
jgi:hypothetical protein